MLSTELVPPPWAAQLINEKWSVVAANGCPAASALTMEAAEGIARLRNALDFQLRTGLGVQRDGEAWAVLTAGGYRFNPVGGPGDFTGPDPLAALEAARAWWEGEEKRKKEAEKPQPDLPPPPEPCQNPVTGAAGLPGCPATHEEPAMAENTGKGTDKGLKESAQGGTKGGAKAPKGGAKKGGTAKGGGKK